MADLSQSIEITLRHEGGYVNNPEDAGGATNMGIEQRDLPNIPIKTLTVAQAVAYYQEHYVKPWMSHIESQIVADKVFDMGVLLGVSTAVRLLQRALSFPNAQQDGEFGPETLSAVNEDGDNLLAPYKAVLAAHFRWIVQQEPSQQEFLQGWLNRAES
jgi:lysozyme family protein